MTLVLIVLASLLLGTISWHFLLGWTSLIALLPVFYVIKVAKGRNWSKLRLGLSLWLISFASMLLAWSWLLSTRPQVWAGINGAAATALVYGVWAVSALATSLGITPLILVVSRRNFDLLSPWALFTVPAAWIVGEYAGSWLFSLVYSGPGATLGAHWNFGNLGFGASVTPLAYLARYLGLFGLSFVVVLINLAFYRLLHRRWLAAASIILGACALSALAFYQYHGSTAKVAVSLASLKEGDLDYAHSLGSQAAAPSKLFVFPEYSFYYQTATPDEQKRDLPKLITADGATINAGLEHARLFTDHHSLITYTSQNGAMLDQQQKTFLIPAGEYLPYWIESALHTLGLANLIPTFNNMNAITPGATPEHVVDVSGLRVGTLSCSGIITPSFYQRLAGQGAEILVNTAALNIFANSPIYSQQNRQIARFQAIANAKPYMQATKSGASYIVDHNGTFVTEAPAGRTMVLAAYVAPQKQTTLYSQFGEWVVYTAAIGLMLLGTYVLLPRRPVTPS